MKEVFLDRLRQLNVQTYIIAGNHDTSFKNTNDINSLSLLLKEYSNITVFDTNPNTITLDGLDIVLCPWLSSTNTESSLKYIQESKASFLMGHFEFQGYEMMKGMLCEHGLDRATVSSFEQVYSGHFHHPSEYGNIKYLGAPYEMVWSDYKGKRGFHVLDTKTRRLKHIKNPHTIFHKLEYEDSDLTIDDVNGLDLTSLTNTYVKVVVKSKNNPYIFDAFIDRLQQANPADLKIVEMSAFALDEGTVWDDIPDSLSLMKRWIEESTIKVDKKKVQAELISIWSEAQLL